MGQVQDWFKSKLHGWSPKDEACILGEAKKLEDLGFDSRLLTREFRGKIQPLTDDVEKRTRAVESSGINEGTPGAFYTNESEMEVVGVQGIYVQSQYIGQALLHEFAHWVTDQWVYSLRDKERRDCSEFDTEKLDADFEKVGRDFSRFRPMVKALALMAKLDLFKEEDEKNLMGLVPDGLTLYGMTSPHEWLAESFKFYFADAKSHLGLREAAPHTYEFVGNLVHGKYFKPEVSNGLGG